MWLMAHLCNLTPGQVDDLKVSEFLSLVEACDEYRKGMEKR